MHYDIDYKGEQNADDKAIEDVQNWLGEGFEKFITHATTFAWPSEHLFRFACSFAGIQGFPVGAIIRKYGITFPPETDAEGF